MSKKKTMMELHRLDVVDYRAASKLPLTVVLDDVRSEMNVGSIFRTADAFRIERICLCGITPVPPRAEIHKTALGAELSVAWEHYDSALEAVERLHAEGYVVCSIEQVHDSVELGELQLDASRKWAVVLGNEVKGVSQAVVDASDLCIEIAQYGTKHSLNVSCCGAIVMWHCSRNLVTDGAAQSPS